MSDTHDDTLAPPAPQRDVLALIKSRKPRTRKFAVCMDDDLAIESDRLHDEADRAERIAANDPTDEHERERVAARARADEAQATVDAATVVFTFQSIGDEAWGKLQDAHPPTQAQSAQALSHGLFSGLAFNPETFRPAAITACCVDPQLDLAMVEGWFHDPAWSTGDLNALYEAARSVNMASSVAEWGKGSGSTLI